eukprot:167128-Chlamydomonas_euryale.AAC.16
MSNQKPPAAIFVHSQHVPHPLKGPATNHPLKGPSTDNHLQRGRATLSTCCLKPVMVCELRTDDAVETASTSGL